MTRMAAIAKLLDYNPETGVLTRKYSTPGHPAGEVVGTRSGTYVQVTIDSYRTYGHRIAWFIMTGKEVDLIDHKDRNTRNNRWDNLRETDRSGNATNAGPRADNKSGHPGVFFNKRHNGPRKWVAYIAKNGKRTYLGRFDNMEDAVKARQEAVPLYHGEFVP